MNNIVNAKLDLAKYSQNELKTLQEHFLSNIPASISKNDLVWLLAVEIMNNSSVQTGNFDNYDCDDCVNILEQKGIVTKDIKRSKLTRYQKVKVQNNFGDWALNEGLEDETELANITNCARKVVKTDECNDLFVPVVLKSRANLRGADLTGIKRRRATLRNSFLNNVNLTDAELPFAKMQGTNLTDANLTNADLHKSDLSNTTLVGANFTGTNLDGAIIEKARVDTNNMLFGTLEQAIAQYGLTATLEDQNGEIRKYDNGEYDPFYDPLMTDLADIFGAMRVEADAEAADETVVRQPTKRRRQVVEEMVDSEDL